MIEKTVFAGFGGQGIISLGQIWVYCGMKEGKRVSFFPFYGAEKRGGIARASCVVSDADIPSPIITRASSAVVMNGDSLEVCADVLDDGGLMIVNSSLVPLSSIPKAILDRFKVIPVAATEIAEKLGNIRMANMVMLGALARHTHALVLEKIESVLEGFFTGSKRKLLSANVDAIQAGFTDTSTTTPNE
ncbi:MAG: 2-oxoacid:acceptor oxidoreductase family protein [Spirochaetales bacterium]|nr:2-oxoacid:acceptor oxidoreductase family protein [Spirochaetales bacterium]